MRETEQIEEKKRRLGQYLSLRTEIEIRLERLERLKNEELLPGRRDDDGSQHTAPAGDRLERAIIRRMEYEARVMPEIEARRAEMREIEDAINALADPMERLALQLRYTEGDNCRPMPWREIASRIFGGYSNSCLLATYRLHGRALENIEIPGTKFENESQI